MSRWSTSTWAARAAWSLPVGSMGKLASPGTGQLLISTHAERDYAELIAASCAVGFLPKTDLSASAIQDLLHNHGDSNPGDPVNGPRET